MAGVTKVEIKESVDKLHELLRKQKKYQILNVFKLCIC